MAQCGRRPVLDAFKKREILAILSVGCSRRTAALYVGCAPSTIGYTARRDPEFAAQIDRAEQASEITLMQHIRQAAMEPKYWRAAAWALERCHPSRYGSGRAGAISIDQIRALLNRFAQIVSEEVPVPKYRKAVLRQFRNLTTKLRSPLVEEPPEVEEQEPDDAEN
ncbi:MAG: hypothetical protein JW809_06775 [Pirellulales bacterium]|nr:hypothetical protein [Pirellulales bacterium]